MKAISGNVFIRIRSTMDDRTESGLFKDVTFNVHGKVMIFAEAISVSEKGSNEIMLEVTPGTPRSRDTKPHYIRNKHYKHDIQVGDRIYFHYLTLEDEGNLIERDGDGYWIYKVPIDAIFLSIRPHPDGLYMGNGIAQKAYMHNQYVLGTDYWGEGWEPVEVDGKTIAGKFNSDGLVIETKDKPIKDHSVITDIRRGIDPYSRHKEVKPGDIVRLTPNCEFENKIENQERWVFTHEDIIAIIRGKDIIPVADYVLIKLKERAYEGDIIVDTEYLKLNNEGEILSSGAMVDDELLSAGTMVKFSMHRSSIIDKKYALVRESSIETLLINSI